VKQRVALVALVALAVLVVLTGCCIGMVAMPGRSFSGAPVALTADEEVLKAYLVEVVEHLSVDIGERNVTRQPAALAGC
jgi:hypothetical protein